MNSPAADLPAEALPAWASWISRPGRWFPLVAAILLAGAAWTAASAVAAADVTGGRVPSPRAGFLAPDFHAETLEGEVLTLSDLRGRPVILNFWATWCPPCRAEMPALEAVYREHGPEAIEIVGMNATSQDREAEVEAFIDELGLTFPIGLDPTGEIQRLYQIRAFPTTFFIDRQGVIREVVIGGPLAEAHLRSVAAELLAEAP